MENQSITLTFEDSSTLVVQEVKIYRVKDLGSVRSVEYGRGALRLTARITNTISELVTASSSLVELTDLKGVSTLIRKDAIVSFYESADGSGTKVENTEINGGFEIFQETPSQIQTAVNALNPFSGDFIESDPTGVTGADAVTNIISLTQAEYEEIGTPDPSTFYIIVTA